MRDRKGADVVGMECGDNLGGENQATIIDLSFCPAQSSVISLKETSRGLY